MPVTIPQDIVEEIVGKLQDHRKALQNCALVSIAFRECSQRYLYSSLAIHLQPPAGSPRRLSYRFLLDILSENALLGTYVREIRVIIHKKSLLDPTFPAILRMLPHIRLLHLICKPYQNLEWDEFSVTTKNELLCIFHSPDLMELYVAGMKLLPASLALYPPSKLKLSNVSFGNISEVTPLESNIPSYHPNLHNRLQYLDAWSSQSINRVMTGLFNPLLFHPLFCLRELDIGQLRSDEDIEACRKALIYAKDLELLILRIHPSHSLKHLDFLSPAFALRRVQLYLGGTWSSSMRWVDCSLKTLPPNNIMKEIFVEINDDVDFHDDTWISLDKSLSGGVLRCLERFSIYLFAYEADLPERPGLSAFFSNKVPGLSSKGFFSMFINNNPVYP